MPAVTATSLLSSGLAASIDGVLNQTAAALAAPGALFRESLSGPAVSAALFDAGAVVAPMRPAALPTPRTVPASEPRSVVASPVREPMRDRMTEVERGLREEVALLRAELRTRPHRLGGYAVLMLVLTAWPMVESALGAAVDFARWMPWDLLWILLVFFVARWAGGGPA